MKIVLISCVSKKQDKPARARELYLSPLFKKGLAYAESLRPDRIFILSAKYGLVELDDKLAPYDTTLNTMTSTEIKAWSEEVAQKLSRQVDLEKDEIIFLAGENYRKHLIPRITHYRVPMQGLGIGKQLQYLTRKLANG